MLGTPPAVIPHRIRFPPKRNDENQHCTEVQWLPTKTNPVITNDIWKPGRITKKKIDNYRCEDYLHQVTNIRHRTTMTKLRLSNHRLAIETGRYMRPYKKPNERICPLCNKEAEDEKHFLVSCPGYQEKRKSRFECLSTELKIPIGKMSTENIFSLLLNPPSNNIELQKIIAKHMHECYEIRKKRR